MIEQNPKNNQRTAAVNKWIEKDESAHLFQLYNKQFPQNRFDFFFFFFTPFYRKMKSIKICFFFLSLALPCESDQSLETTGECKRLMA